MSNENIYSMMVHRNVAVAFDCFLSFKIFCSFLNSKNIRKKNNDDYYWNKYGEQLCVTISENGNFKCGSKNYYTDNGREIIIYDKSPCRLSLIDI